MWQSPIIKIHIYYLNKVISKDIKRFLYCNDVYQKLQRKSKSIQSTSFFIAQTLASVYAVTLTYCSSTPGVMKDLNDPSSVIPTITSSDFATMVADGTISEGMIPKLQNAFEAINSGVSRVIITSASALSSGTTIMADPETDD